MSHYQAREEVSKEYYENIKSGDSVTITLLPEKPSLVEIEKGFKADYANHLNRIAFLLFAVTGLIIVSSARWAIMAIQTRRYGEVKSAIILKVEQDGVIFRGRQRGRIYWKAIDGTKGESLLEPMDWLEKYGKENQNITIYSKGDLTYWEEDVGPRSRRV